MMSQVFLVNSCSIIDDDLMAAFEREGIADTQEKRDVLDAFVGFTSIISPFGTYLAGPEVNNEEKIITAEIDMEDIVEAKYAHNPLGHHDRWDVARLLINPERTYPLQRFGPTPGVEYVQPGAEALDGESPSSVSAARAASLDGDSIGAETRAAIVQ